MSSTRTLTILLALCSLAALPGCASLDTRSQSPGTFPDGATSPDWMTDPSAASTARIDLSSWWNAWNDPELNRLVTRAADSSLTIAEARTRIVEARARLTAADGRQRPTVNARAGASAQRQSENGTLPIGRIGLDRDITVFEAGLDASWEADLFGSVAAGREAADQRLAASAADLEAVRLSVVAETARIYLDLRAAQREAALQEALVTSLRESLAHAQRRLAAGDVSMREVDAARLRLEAAEASPPLTQARARAAAIALAVLAGLTPEAEAALLDQPPPMQADPVPELGARADVLARRPDVTAAQARLRAAAGDLTVSTAELFPRLTLSLSAGWQATALGDLLDTGSQTASVTPLIRWRIFDRNQVRADIAASRSRLDLASRNYTQAVVAALGDAERAASDLAATRDARSDRQAASDAAASLRSHADRRFAAGDIARPEVLDTEQALLDARIAQTRQEAATEAATVVLFKALGGGW
jgi:NodT family efflux transporter outer membrane factor (OMF) lipoprotein